MKYYPVFLRVAGRRCVVIGGGTIATRKVESLLAAGAGVAVISPSLTADLTARAARGEIEHVARTYRPGDLAGAMKVQSCGRSTTLSNTPAASASHATAACTVSSSVAA